MKNILTILSLAALLTGCESIPENGFLLKGRIGTLNAPAKIYLTYWSGGEEHRDSAVLNNGRFTLSGTLDGPAYSRLVLDYEGQGMRRAARGGNMKLFYLEAGKVVIQSPDSLQNISFDQSPINMAYHDYLEQVGGQVQEISARMNAKFAASSPEEQQDTAFMNKLNAEFRRLHYERAEKQQAYAKEHPESYFSIVALSEGAGPHMDVDVIEPIFLAIEERHRNTVEGKAFAKRIEAAKSVGIGLPAPDFTQNDTEGNPVSLSSFRGKYVLLDFWASWCGPCRAESPVLVEAYARFKERGFEILGVSLDKEGDNQAWLDAIEKDGLGAWTNVSDLNSWNNAAALLYGIRAIPQNYLIDPQGVIVAENLRGEKLIPYLEELFNKK